MKFTSMMICSDAIIATFEYHDSTGNLLYPYRWSPRLCKVVKLLFVARLENMYYFVRQYYSLLDLLENPSLLQTSGYFVHELEL